MMANSYYLKEEAIRGDVSVPQPTTSASKTETIVEDVEENVQEEFKETTGIASTEKPGESHANEPGVVVLVEGKNLGSASSQLALNPASVTTTASATLSVDSGQHSMGAEHRRTHDLSSSGS